MNLIGKLLDLPGKAAGAAAETVASLPGVVVDVATKTPEGIVKGMERTGEKIAGKGSE